MGIENSKQSTENIRQEESLKIQKETEIERIWWQDKDKFPTQEEAGKALEKGDLAIVPRNGENYRLIGRLNGEEEGEPNTLRPETLRFLNSALEKWRERLGGRFGEIRLAVTSLYRDAALQEKLNLGEFGYRSSKSQESSHLAGASFDVSCRSFYAYVERDDSFTPVQSWNPESGRFEPEVFTILRETLGELKNRGLCNFIIENKIDENGSEPTVFHVCVNPNPPQT